MSYHQGRFRGGCAPYGYQLIKRGRIGKKNRELYDIEVNPDEAIAVNEIFNLADRYGYGGRRISSELKDSGIYNIRTGESFHYSSIQNILKNIMYMGILRSGENQSEIFPELQIIAPEQSKRAKSVDERSFVKQQVQISTQQYRQKLIKAKADYSKATSELTKWEDLMLDSLEGKRVFTLEQIKNRMESVRKRVNELIELINQLQEQSSEAEAIVHDLMAQHKHLLSWAEMFDSASPQEKKIIAPHLIKAMTLT